MVLLPAASRHARRASLAARSAVPKPFRASLATLCVFGGRCYRVVARPHESSAAGIGADGVSMAGAQHADEIIEFHERLLSSSPATGLMSILRGPPV
jgi:hypothetical protein